MKKKSKKDKQENHVQFMISFYKRLNKLCNERNYPHYGRAAFLSKKLNASYSSVFRWLEGTAVPSQEKLEDLAKHFNISVDYLLLGTDNKKEEENE